MNEPNLFVFEIIFNDSDGFDPRRGAFPLNGRSVVVAVEPARTARFVGVHHSSEVDRGLAEETAQQAALQTIQKDFPEGFAPGCDIVQLHSVPDRLRRRLPTLYAGRAYAWLV